jgi:oxygen-independent coproporphyrinogen III oxidase
MLNPVILDPELLRRYDRPGPRYTSYPTAPQFHTQFAEQQFRDVCLDSNDDLIPRALSLYAHIPFCHSPCFYCGCNKVVTRNKVRSAQYLERLKKEIRAVSRLFDRDRELVQLHFGGGTPNFFSIEQLADLTSFIAAHFSFAELSRRDFSIEIDPRHVNPDDMQALAEIGFNRCSIGVQDFDRNVQRAVNRIQSAESILGIINACRQAEFRSVNIDLIYGLPKQSIASFTNTLEITLQARPDRIAIYGYAHMPQLFRAQRQLDQYELPDAEMRLDLLHVAIDKLMQAGYDYIGMDHFALLTDELSKARQTADLHRNFMGYTTHAQTDLVGVGVSAISHINQCYSQNQRDLLRWESEIDANRLPTWRGFRMGKDDLIRAEVIQQIMCRGGVNIQSIEKSFSIDFNSYFLNELTRLAALEQDGLIELGEDKILVSDKGRLLLRCIAACFDAYLHTAQPAPTQFSKTV